MNTEYESPGILLQFGMHLIRLFILEIKRCEVEIREINSLLNGLKWNSIALRSENLLPISQTFMAVITLVVI